MKESYLHSGRSNQKLETRKKILSATRQLLAKGGSITLEDVAKHIDISRASIYRYYSNINVLISEAGIAVPEESQHILNALTDLNLADKLRAIQQYYNTYTLQNETAFRRFLSTQINADQSNNKRGGRRTSTLTMALEKSSLNSKEKKDLAQLLTLFMGMEPFIITKDVCGLNNKASLELLQWGFDLILKGIDIESKDR